MFDTIKDYVSPKRFSTLAFICIIIHFHCGILFTAITTALRMTEMEKFNCAVNTNSAPHKTYVEKTCFSIYDNAYNSPMRFCVFVMLSFSSVVAVIVIYSLAVSSRIDETERDYTGTDKSQTAAKKRNADERGIKTFYVFNFYIFHLLVRVVLGVLFTIIQYTVLYPNGFDKQFRCVYLTLEQPNTNIITTKNTSVSQSIVTCENSTASDKQFWGKIVSVFNVIVAVLALLEIIYLIPHRFPYFTSRSDIAWSNDSEFIVVYLFRVPYVRNKIELTGVDNCCPDSGNIYKQSVLNTFLTPDINYGPNTNLDDMFIDVVIQTEQAPHNFMKDMKRHEIYNVYTKVPEHSIRLKEIKDLFYVNKDTKGNSPRTILVLGRPGIGKTVLTRKIMRDWANGIDEFYHGKISFFFKFRWFDFDMLQNITLKRFLQFGTVALKQNEFEDIFREISLDPRRAIFIFDGLDEFGRNVKEFENYLDQSEMFPNEPTIPMPAIILFIKLLFGNLFKSSTALVTSRPTAVNFLSKLKFDRHVEIIGFTSDKIETYVETFCANHNKTNFKPKIWSHISSSSEVKNLCFIPVNCFIVCGTLVNCLSDPTNHNPLPTTLTELYLAALIYFNQHHDRNENNGYHSKAIEELQQLAFYGMENDQLIFDGELASKRMKESGLLHCLPVPFFQIQTQVCFIHLTVQEFLAAKHVIETKESKGIRDFILSHVEHGKWHLVLQFLAGLLGRKMKMHGEYRSCVLAFAEHLQAQNMGDDIVCDLHASQILCMKCLRESEDESTAKETSVNSRLKYVTRIPTFYQDKLSPSDWAAVVFVCKHLVHLTDLELQGIVNLDCLLEVTKLLQQRCIRSLNLIDSNLDDLSLQCVLSALMTQQCQLNHEHSHLSEFKLSRNKITDEGVLHLSAFLTNGCGTRLKTLDLGANEITSCGISILSEVLTNGVCNQLTQLDLSSNAIGNEGVRCLCKLLIDKQFKLRKLGLTRCSLTTACMPWLVEVLSDVDCEITDLSLGGNDIGDDGVRMTCCALWKGQRKFSRLDVSNCSLTKQCMSCFLQVLGDENCNLTELSIGPNCIGDEGVRRLCSALGQKHCNLTKLGLVKCFLTDKCVHDLSKVLENECCKLTSLQLSGNDIGDDGVRLLCRALRKVQCKLTVLDISSCSLTDECMPFLCEAIKDEHCRLVELNVNFNAFTDKYVSLLSDALKLEHCCLRRLHIRQNDITREGRKLLENSLKN